MRSLTSLILLHLLPSVLLSTPPALAQYDPSGSGYSVKVPPLTTDWTDKVGTNPWTEYPRPQQVREKWQSLNGIWRYQKALGLNELSNPPTGKGDGWGKAVMIPSCIESALSGLMVDFADNEYSWFQTKFSVPADWNGQEVLVNFGAIDYEATIFVNGQKIDSHKGGYTRFALSIGSHINFGQDNELLVFVHDPTDDTENMVAVGKQTVKPSHIFYTPCSGIWQSVFIEPVPKTYIDRIDLSGDKDGLGTIYVHTKSPSSQPVSISVADAASGTAYVTNGQSDGPFNFSIPNVQTWSPNNPNLYDVTVTLGEDVVKTYVGFRSLGKGKVQGVTRPMLNGEFIFAFGTLDQGYWPDGLYTPPSYEAMTFDLKYLKNLGFNMVRKHIKVEPDLFYRACDELGLLVIQDMPSMTAQPKFKPNDQQQAQWEAELKEMINLHKSFPSIYTWVVYNEGWAQRVEGPEVQLVPKLQELDPTRLFDAVSGWNDHGAGDYFDTHSYPESLCGMDSAGANTGPYDHERIGFQGEFGGMGHNVSIDHLWNDPGAIAAINQTYEIAPTIGEWNSRTQEILDVLRRQVEQNACSGGVWTQTTDVEGEINGLMTYDRRISRVDEKAWKADILSLFTAARGRGAGTGAGGSEVGANTQTSLTTINTQATGTGQSTLTNKQTGGAKGRLMKSMAVITSVSAVTTVSTAYQMMC
ncbi:hypothetical protein IAU60_002937 [Kwoniella sp. DSM 27419]